MKAIDLQATGAETGHPREPINPFYKSLELSNFLLDYFTRGDSIRKCHCGIKSPSQELSYWMTPSESRKLQAGQLTKEADPMRRLQMILSLSIYVSCSVVFADAFDYEELPGVPLSAKEMHEVRGALSNFECKFQKKMCGCYSSDDGDSCEQASDCGIATYIHSCDEPKTSKYHCCPKDGETCQPDVTGINCGDMQTCGYRKTKCFEGECFTEECNTCSTHPYLVCDSANTCQ
jgi:hypothetical protein